MVDARRLALLITPERLQKHRSVHVIDGVAGAVLCLLALDELEANEELRVRAIACGESLQNHASVVSGLPAAVRAECAPGFAQGAAGAALVLARLNRATGEDCWNVAARDTLILDAHLIDGDAPVDASWHSGVAGYLLAQTAIVGMAGEIGHAVSRIRAAIWDGGDSAAHGGIGRVDALTVAAAFSPDLQNAARAIGAAVAARAAAGGGYRLGWSGGYRHVGLFEGISRVGYGLLRLEKPALLPSVLRWR